MYLGDVVKLKVQCLGNEPGSIGIVYEEYSLSGQQGASVIFENGEYDGFSEEEQGNFLEKIGFCRKLSYYPFVGVMQLSDDFRAGVFDMVLKRKEYQKIQ